MIWIHAPPLGFETYKFQIQEGKMYIEHPYLYEGKYYAKVDNQFVEITKEVAYAMNNFYRNSLPKKVDIKDENGEIIDHVRREISYSEANDLSGESDFSIETVADTSLSVEDTVIENLERSEMLQLIDTLPEEERYIIVSIFYKGEIKKDVAEELNISRPMLTYKLKSALKKLRYKLEELDLNKNLKEENIFEIH